MIRKTYCIIVLTYYINFGCLTLSPCRTPMIWIHSIQNEFIELFLIIFEKVILGSKYVFNTFLNWYLNEYFHTNVIIFVWKKIRFFQLFTVFIPEEMLFTILLALLESIRFHLQEYSIDKYYSCSMSLDSWPNFF